MTSSARTHGNVLVIGAGPSGLFVAAELARHGVKARLVEQTMEPHTQARATSIQPGTLEILEAVGLARPFLEAGERVAGFCVRGPGLDPLRTLTFEGIDCRYDFLCSLPQYVTEHILESRLISLGGVVERGITATKMERGVNGVEIELRHSQGTVETVQASMVIDAGGAHCLARTLPTTVLDGMTYAGQFLVADIAMETPFPRDRSNVVCSRQGPLLLAPLPGGRWICFLEWAEASGPASAEEITSGVETRLGGRGRPSQVFWFSSFRSHRRMAGHLADGRCFLVGDSGHVSSPFGGEGLNAGLHDAFDLAWKLALVCRGEAQPCLLENYATERLIADRHVLDTSDQVHRAIFELANAVRDGRELPPSADPVATALLRNARAMIDVDYRGSPLVEDHADDRDRNQVPHPGQRYPEWTAIGATMHQVLVFGPVAEPGLYARLEKRWSPRVRFDRQDIAAGRRAGVCEGGIVVVRPDGHIGFRASATDAECWAAVDRHLSGYLIPCSRESVFFIGSTPEWNGHLRSSS